MSDIIIGLDTLEGVDMVRFQKADRTGYAGFWNPDDMDLTQAWSQDSQERVVNRDDDPRPSVDMGITVPGSYIPHGSTAPIIMITFYYNMVAGALTAYGSTACPWVLRPSDFDENGHYGSNYADNLLEVYFLAPTSEGTPTRIVLHFNDMINAWFDRFSAVNTIKLSNRFIRVKFLTGKDPNPS